MTEPTMDPTSPVDMPPDAQVETARKRAPNFGRRIVWLGVFVLVMIAAYTGAWFYFANLLETQTRMVLADAAAQGLDADCANAQAGGYPFRMGVFCDTLRIADPARNLSVSTQGFRTAAQIYDLRHIVGEVDGPATVELPDAGSFRLDWDGLRASVQLAEPLPQRVSVEGQAVRLQSSAGTPLGSAGALEGHMRPNGADVDLATAFDDLAIAPALIDGRTLPALGGRSDVSITNGVARFTAEAAGLRGMAGTIRLLSLTAGSEGGVSVSGPFAIGYDGRLTAELMLTLTNPKGLSAVLSTAFPEARKQIGNVMTGLAFLGSSPSLPLKIVNGQASIGFIPLGQIPPV